MGEIDSWSTYHPIYIHASYSVPNHLTANAAFHPRVVLGLKGSGWWNLVCNSFATWLTPTRRRAWRKRWEATEKVITDWLFCLAFIPLDCYAKMIWLDTTMSSHRSGSAFELSAKPVDVSGDVVPYQVPGTACTGTSFLVHQLHIPYLVLRLEAKKWGSQPDVRTSSETFSVRPLSPTT